MLFCFVVCLFCFYFLFLSFVLFCFFFFFQAEDGIRDHCVTGVHVCSSDLRSEMQARREAEERAKAEKSEARRQARHQGTMDSARERYRRGLITLAQYRMIYYNAICRDDEIGRASCRVRVVIVGGTVCCREK